MPRAGASPAGASCGGSREGQEGGGWREAAPLAKQHTLQADRDCCCHCPPAHRHKKLSSRAVRLLPPPVAAAAGLPPAPPGVAHSAGFVMVNLGLRGTVAELGLTPANTIWLPVDADGDADGDDVCRCGGNRQRDVGRGGTGPRSAVQGILHLNTRIRRRRPHDEA